jgi:hypothetical protein
MVEGILACSIKVKMSFQHLKKHFTFQIGVCKNIKILCNPFSIFQSENTFQDEVLNTPQIIGSEYPTPSVILTSDMSSGRRMVASR